MCHFLSRRLPFKIISNRRAEARSRKQAPGWWISPKKFPPKFPGIVWYRTVSVCCMISAECQACEVQRLLLQFLAECTTSNNASAWSVTSTKEEWSELRWRFPINVYGLWRNSGGDTFQKIFCSTQYRSLCSRSRHLFWRTFLQKQIAKEDHILRYTQNLITTLKIWFCYAKV